ncbi:MAG: hypothetical protein KBD01_04455 [Acidobacteria bacterium]|nr:hypothetical protein [Acidobacteriota bacterium]
MPWLLLVALLLLVVCAVFVAWPLLRAGDAPPGNGAGDARVRRDRPPARRP